jgi:LmbE family N-acetylglucosaminyl deacetylase
MKFSRPEADVFLPAGGDAAQALARTTHLCVIAHQDDIEINAYPAVTECLGRADRFFTGVVMTNGAGSARTGKFAHVTDAQMQEQGQAIDIQKMLADDLNADTSSGTDTPAESQDAGDAITRAIEEAAKENR